MIKNPSGSAITKKGKVAHEVARYRIGADWHAVNYVDQTQTVTAFGGKTRNVAAHSYCLFFREKQK